MKKVLIIGSSRKDGGTYALVKQFRQLTNWDVIDLNDYDIGYFDYNYSNKHDDYLKLMHEIIENYKTLVFVTPVYWHAMSGVMKVFFDRITDLLTIKKDLGQKLKGKQMAVVSNSAGNNLGGLFWLPFSETANYLGMEYLGHVHTISNQDNEENLKVFIEKLQSKTL